MRRARRARHEGDAAHEAAAIGAAGGVAVDRRLIACGRIDNDVGLIGRGGGVEVDQPPAAGEIVAAIAVGEEAVVADAVEAVRQCVEKEADKLVNGPRNLPSLGRAKFPTLAGVVISRWFDRFLRSLAAGRGAWALPGSTAAG